MGAVRLSKKTGHSFIEMRKFKNQKIKDLYRYLANDFDENEFYFVQPVVLKELGIYIDVLDENDWVYFEKNIHLWDSEILDRFARVISEYKPRQFDYILRAKIYCLALIHCLDEESLDLCFNLPAEIGLAVDLEVNILEKVMIRLKELLVNLERTGDKGITKRAIDFLKEKLKAYK